MIFKCCQSYIHLDFFFTSSSDCNSVCQIMSQSEGRICCWARHILNHDELLQCYYIACQFPKHLFVLISTSKNRLHCTKADVSSRCYFKVDLFVVFWIFFASCFFCVFQVTSCFYSLSLSHTHTHTHTLFLLVGNCRIY